MTQNTIQLWPSGRMVSYRSNGSDYEIVVDPRIPRICRSCTPDELYEIRRAEMAQRLMESDVLCCDSCLVGDLLNACAAGVPPHNPLTSVPSGLWDAFQWDAVENVYSDFSQCTLHECREYIGEYGGEYPDPNPWELERDALIDLLGMDPDDAEDMRELQNELQGLLLRFRVIAAADDGNLPEVQDAWREAAQDLANDNPAEPLEWWRVTSGLCEHLRALGEVVLDNDYGCWWGRCTSGQSLIMDGTLQAVADRVLRS